MTKVPKCSESLQRFIKTLKHASAEEVGCQ